MTLIEKFNSEQELKSFLIDKAVDKYSNKFGTEVPYYPWFDFDFSSDVTVTGNLASVSFDTASAGSFAEADTASFSETNTQEAGVDEADLVETDGSFIYQVTGKQLSIVDARNADQLSIASQTDLSDLGNISGAYLYEDQLTVISSISPWQYWYGGPSFGFENRYSTPKVNVTVLDVSNPKDVEIEETSLLDGRLVSSRAIGDQVYVVTRDNLLSLPSPILKPIEKEGEEEIVEFTPVEKEVPTETTEDIDLDINKDLDVDLDLDLSIFFPDFGTGVYETEEEYLERIKGQELELALPEFTTVDSDGKVLREGLLSQAENTYKPLEEGANKLTSVSVFDVDDSQPGPKTSIAIPADYFSETYVSSENLYLLGNRWSGQQQTDILKVDLNPLEVVADGNVPGRIIDQFSADEENGYFRIATTEGSGRNTEHNVFVLQQQGQTLNTVGSITGIAPGETLHSTRFEGDKGFLVTFQQVDPFYTVDLSDPKNPEIPGELELPGFSEYLQVIDNGDKTQVLGVGRESNDLKVTLFDATDFDDPEEVDSYVFDGRYSSSEAQWDHHAVGYYPEFDTLAIPFRSTDGKGLKVFGVDAEDGFDEVGDITHGGDAIRRSLIIDDELYAISNGQVTAHDITTLELVDEVSIPQPQPQPTVYNPYGVSVVPTSNPEINGSLFVAATDSFSVV
ncbi:MAG: beta-propeller domain-containing protein [Microcoleaceae cyanobacterium]